MSVAPESDAGLEELLRAAKRDHEPSAADRAAVERALRQRLASEAASSAAAAPARSSWLPGFNAWFVAAALTLLAASAWFHAQRSREVSRAAPAAREDPEPEAATSADTSPPQLELATGSLPPPVVAPSNTRVSPAAEARPRNTSSVSLEHKDARLRVPEPHRIPAAASAGERPAPPRAAEQQALAAQPAAAPSKLSAQSVAGAAREPEQSELAFMRRIHSALGDAELRQVLELCAEHARRWPRGVFEQEREGVRVLAGCALQLPDSERDARAYFARFAQSPLTPRIRAACKTSRKAKPELDSK